MAEYRIVGNLERELNSLDGYVYHVREQYLNLIPL